MVKVNQNFQKLPGGYLFPEIGRRVRAFSAQNPPMPLIRLGIGDVTQPLAPVVIEAMEKVARISCCRFSDMGCCIKNGVGKRCPHRRRKRAELRRELKNIILRARLAGP